MSEARGDEYKGRAFFCYRFREGVSELGYSARAEVLIVRVHGEGPRVVFAEYWNSESEGLALENVRIGKRAFERSFFEKRNVYELGWDEFDEVVERGAPGMPDALRDEMLAERSRWLSVEQGGRVKKKSYEGATHEG